MKKFKHRYWLCLLLSFIFLFSKTLFCQNTILNEKGGTQIIEEEIYLDSTEMHIYLNNKSADPCNNDIFKNNMHKILNFDPSVYSIDSVGILDFSSFITPAILKILNSEIGDSVKYIFHVSYGNTSGYAGFLQGELYFKVRTGRTELISYFLDGNEKTHSVSFNDTIIDDLVKNFDPIFSIGNGVKCSDSSSLLSANHLSLTVIQKSRIRSRFEMFWPPHSEMPYSDKFQKQIEFLSESIKELVINNEKIPKAFLFFPENYSIDK